MKTRESWQETNIENQEKKERLLSEIDSKIGFMLKLFNELETKAEVLTENDFSGWCLDMMKEIEETFPQEAAYLRQIQEYEKDINALSIQEKLLEQDFIAEKVPLDVLQKIDLVNHDVISELLFGEEEIELPKDTARALESLMNATTVIQNESDGLHEKIAEIYDKFPEIKFLEHVSNFFNDMRKKKKETEDSRQLFDHDQELFFVNVQKKCDHYISKNIHDAYLENKALVRVEFSGVHTLITIDDSLWDDLGPGKNIEGFHYSGTAYSIVRAKAAHATLPHEKNHNLYDSLDAHRAVYWETVRRQLENRLGMFQNLKKLRTPSAVLEAHEKLCLSSVDKILENLFGEVFADLSAIFEGNVDGFVAHFVNMNKNLKQFINELPDDELKEKIKDKRLQLEKRFYDFLKSINDELFISKKTNTQDELKMAMILFSHDVRKVERFMIDRVGEDAHYALNTFYNLLNTSDRIVLPGEPKNRRAEQLHRFVSGAFGASIIPTLGSPEIFFEPNILSKLVTIENLPKHLELLNPQELGSMRETLSERVFIDTYAFFAGVLVAANVKDWDKDTLEKYTNNLSSILTILDEESKINDCLQNVQSCFVWEKIKRVVVEDDPDILENILPIETAYFSAREMLTKDSYWKDACDLFDIQNMPVKTAAYLKRFQLSS